MKKLFAVVLAILMVLSMAAYAEGVNIPKAVQDEQPPAVVMKVNPEGKPVVAKLHDKDGNVLAEVLNDGSLMLTDVNARKEVANAAVTERLTKSYEDVMDGVHYSDVECKLHDHDLKVDINDILTSLQHDMNAHDLVMYEMFDVNLDGAAKDILAAEDNYLEITFSLTEDQWLPLIFMYSTNGDDWQAIQHADADGNTFTVRIPASGSLALLADGHEVMGIGEEYVPGEYIPGTPGGEYYEGSPFTPSVSGKPAPQLVTFMGTDGQYLVGYIRSSAGDVEIPVPNKNYVQVTAVSERDYVADIQTHEHLDWAYENILNAEDIGELYTEHDASIVIPDHEHGTIAGLLDATLNQMGLDLTHDQLVVKDLFEVSVYGDYVHYLYNPDYYVEMTFKTDLEPNKPVVVLHSPDSVHWHVHPLDEFEVGADGTVTLDMYDMGVVAFLVEAEEKVDLQNAVMSPV